jgi:three-Cys-motif partner protein
MTTRGDDKRAQEFGGAHTELKLSVVVDYLRSYATALKNKGFEITCVDAFAGSGWRRVQGTDERPERDLFAVLQPASPPELPGSAVRLMRSGAPIERYVFNDRNRANSRSLQQTVLAERERNPSLPPAEVFNLDAAALIRQECQRLREKSSRRALMFLDPFGLQLSHTDMSEIAATGAADVWLLVPTGMALSRLAPRRKEPSDKFKSALTRFFGSKERWEQFYTTTREDMFGRSAVERHVSIDAISAYVLEWMQEIFGPGAYSRGLSLRPTRWKAEQYLLVFACANRRPGAFELAHRIAGRLIDNAEGRKPARGSRQA